PFVAVVVTMAHAPVEHVGDGLEAPVRVLRETGDVVLRALGAEFVQQQERVQLRQRRAADHPGQAHAGAVGSGHAADDALDTGGVVHGPSSRGMTARWWQGPAAPSAGSATDRSATGATPAYSAAGQRGLRPKLH